MQVDAGQTRPFGSSTGYGYCLEAFAHPGRATIGLGAVILSFLKRLTRHLALWFLLGLVVAGVCLERTVSARMQALVFDAPATIRYAPLSVSAGSPVRQAQLHMELAALGYRSVATPTAPGTWSDSPPLTIWPRGAGEPVQITFGPRGITRITSASGALLEGVELEGQVLGRFYPQDDRVLAPTTLDALPPALVQALLVVEDRRFFRHFGVDVLGILRALLANVGAGRVVAGGSTITQQLAKTWFVGSQRTVERKLRELAYALILELRFSKAEILQAYVNSVYLGQSGRYEIRGFGSAAEFYFGRPVTEIDVAESALLVGLLKGASYYNPWRHPERARARRNLILEAMAQAGALESKRAQQAMRRPLGIKQAPELPEDVDLKRFIARGLRAELSPEALKAPGLSVESTIDPISQNALERAFETVLGSEADARNSGLEGAGVVIDYRTGALRALVAGVQTENNVFDRSVMARRSVGSLIKPFIYLGWFEQMADRHPFSIVADTPITLRNPDGTRWQPENYDRRAHGTVTAAEALAGSYNLAAVRVGLDAGLPRLARTLKRAGLERDITLYPSAFLGAVALSPLEVAEVFQTLANGGMRQPLFSVAGLRRDGKTVRVRPPRGQRTLDSVAVSKTAYLMTRVTREGTGRRVRAAGLWPVAGKTGTTDDVRDYWFVAFDARELAVIWVGHDDNRPMSTAAGNRALAVWLAWAEEVGVQRLPLFDNEAWEWVTPKTADASVTPCAYETAFPLPAGRSLGAFARCQGVSD